MVRRLWWGIALCIVPLTVGALFLGSEVAELFPMLLFGAAGWLAFGLSERLHGGAPAAGAVGVIEGVVLEQVGLGGAPDSAEVETATSPSQLDEAGLEARIDALTVTAWANPAFVVAGAGLLDLFWLISTGGGASFQGGVAVFLVGVGVWFGLSIVRSRRSEQRSLRTILEARRGARRAPYDGDPLDPETSA